MIRTALVVLAALTAFALVTGVAASMAVTSTDLGAGNVLVAGCDDTIHVAFGLAAGDVTNVSTVELSDVAAACDGQTYHLELVDSAGTVLQSASGTVAQVGGVQTITLASPVPAASITTVNVTITG